MQLSHLKASGTKFDRAIKCEGQPKVFIYIDLIEVDHQKAHIKFPGNLLCRPGEKTLFIIQHTKAWRTSWSCDMDQT